MTTKEIKAAVLTISGVERVRVRAGEIHAYGQMPNSSVRCWWLVGYVQDAKVKGLAGIGIAE